MSAKVENYSRMTFKGRVEDVESFGEGQKKRYFHQMTIPGKNEYDRPSGIIVVSKRMIGSEGDVKEVTVDYSGFIKVNRWVDKKGERQEFKQLQARFTEVEVTQ